jgi:DNA replication protein DnaC
LVRPAASPINNLKMPGRPEPKPTPAKRECWCGDGISLDHDGSIKVFDCVYRVNLRSAYYFHECDLGRAKAAEWQKENCPDCEVGFIFEPDHNNKATGRKVSGYCTKCEFGKSIIAELEEFKERQSVKVIEEWRGKSGLAPLQLKQTFDNYICKVGGPGEKAIVLLKTAAKEKKSILIVGNTGVGKSHLAAAYLNFSLSIGNNGKFISLTELMAALRKTINAKPDYTEHISWDDLLEKYITAPLLVLDDIGQEKPSEKVNEVLFTLLNSRINWERPTVVTTNYGKDILLETGYSPAIVSRLGSFEVIRLTGEDYRVKNRGNLKIVDPWQ